MKKNLFIFICTALFTVLLTSNLGAQQVRKLDEQSKLNSVHRLLAADEQIAPTTRGDIVFTEGFESTSGPNGSLPTGWTKTGTAWVTVDNTSQLPGIDGEGQAPYSGTREMARSWQNASQSAWAFTPAISCTEGHVYKVTFWYTAPGYPPEGEFDNFEVKAGKTASAAGMTDLVFKLVDTEVHDWTMATGKFVATTTGNYFVGFHCTNGASAGIWITIDEITVSDEGEVVFCPKVSDLEVEIQGTDAKVKWTAAEGEPTGYKVYDGSTLLGTVKDKTYLAKNLTSGSHTFGVEAIYSDGCEPILVTKTVDMPVALNPIKNLNGSCIEGIFNLNWTKPDDNIPGFNDWLSYSKGNYGGVLGSSSTGIYYYAQRWSPADLAAKEITTGSSVTKLKFSFNSHPSVPVTSGYYQLKIWQGTSSLTAGTEKFSSDDIPVTSISSGTWHEITLDTPVAIDPTLELWIGVYTNVNVGGYPISYDNTETVLNCNLFKSNTPTGNWTKVEAVGGWTKGNLMVAGFVITEGGTPIELTHYDIYKDNVKLDETIETEYTKTGIEGQGNYCVVAVYDNDAQSPKVCKSVVCGNCYPPTDLGVTFGPNCQFATITWKKASTFATEQCNIYRDSVLIKEKHSTTTYIDQAIDKHKSHTWEVRAICPNGSETEGVVLEKEACEPIGPGVNENAKTKFSIVPNPATNNITVTAGSNFHTIEFISFLGQTVLSQPNVGNTTKIDVSDLSNGIYFVRIISENGTSVQKFVKQ